MRLRTVLISAALAATTTVGPAVVMASSHREAPFISKNPKVDGTDLYAFMSYESGRTCPAATTGPCGYVTILANYEPLEGAAGGPNFFTMDPDALYEIEIDNTGDGVEDLTFQFQFTSTLAGGTGVTLPVNTGSGAQNIAIPFAYVGGTGVDNPSKGFGAITSTLNGSGGGSASVNGAQNVTETYTVNAVVGPRRSGTVTPVKDTSGNATFNKPIDNVGPNTVGNGATPDYATYANTFITSIPNSAIPGCNPTHVPAGTTSRVFVGQRQEGFAVNLGQVFDTVNFSVGPDSGKQTTPGINTDGIDDVIGLQDQGLNDVAGFNVTTIALEIPAECIANPTTNVFGVWTTASVPQARVINPTASFSQPTREGGPLVQVSRLGMPLVNEVVIGLPDKDRWNGGEPADDGSNGFNAYVVNPTLPVVLHTLFGGAGVVAPTGGAASDRPDLVEIFGTGVSLDTAGGTAVNLTQIIANPTVAAEMLRVNTNIAGQLGANLDTPTSAAAQNSQLGALGCLDNPSATTATLANVDPGNSDCDLFGFPNGRRPGDDVTDITIRAAMGAVINTTDAPHGGCLHIDGATNLTSKAVIGPGAVDTLGPGGCIPYVDGAANNATNMQSVFPYLNSPLSGGKT
jgi:hypothetical protein